MGYIQNKYGKRSNQTPNSPLQIVERSRERVKSKCSLWIDWAKEANEMMKSFIVNEDFRPLINYKSQGTALNLAIPPPEHFLPLLYALALKEESDHIEFFNDKAVAGSLTMTSLKIK